MPAIVAAPFDPGFARSEVVPGDGEIAACGVSLFDPAADFAFADGVPRALGVHNRFCLVEVDGVGRFARDFFGVDFTWDGVDFFVEVDDGRFDVIDFFVDGRGVDGGDEAVVEVDGIVEVLEEPVFDLVGAAAEGFCEFDGGAFLGAWLVLVSLEVVRDENDIVLEFFEIGFRGLS